MDSNLKDLMKQLGDTINSSLSESEPIAEVISRIKHHGYDVFLVLEATIGFNRRDSELTTPVPIERSRHDRDPEFSVNAQDMSFLRSLRIAVDDDNSDHHAA